MCEGLNIHCQRTDGCVPIKCSAELKPLLRNARLGLWCQQDSNLHLRLNHILSFCKGTRIHRLYFASLRPKRACATITLCYFN